MTQDQFEELCGVIVNSELLESQRRQLIKLLKQRKADAITPIGGVGVHISTNDSDNLDRDILSGLSQKDACLKYHISSTTYKRHRQKLYEQGHTIPNYEPISNKQLFDEYIKLNYVAEAEEVEDESSSQTYCDNLTPYEKAVKKWGKYIVDEYGVEALAKIEEENKAKMEKVLIERELKKQNVYKGRGIKHTSSPIYNVQWI